MTTHSMSLRSRFIGRGMASGFAALRGSSRLRGDETVEDLAREVERIRPQFEALAARAVTPPSITITPVDAAGVPAEFVRHQRSDPDRVVMHVHGGAYVLCSPLTHRGITRSLARVARARVFVPDYRLAPEHPFPAALDDVVTAYRWLVEEEGVAPDRVAVSGDSAGGGLGLALLVRLRDEGLPLPACYVGLSPWTDLAGTGASLHQNNGDDVLFGAIPTELAPRLGQLYAGDTPLDHPLVSPLYADLRGLPPMLVHVGDSELIRDDGLRLVGRARLAGVDASAGRFHGMWHVFQAFPIPEASLSYREIGGFVRRHTERRG